MTIGLTLPWLRSARAREAIDRLRSGRHAGCVLRWAILMGGPSFMAAATPVVQLRGTIKDISSSGNKLTGETTFELSATEEKYGVRVIEAVVQPARAGYYVSNLRDIFSSTVAASSADPSESPQVRRAMASFRPGSLPDALAPRAQALAYAHLALRLPKSGEGDAAFVERVIPKFILTAIEMEKAELEAAHLVRNRDGGLERINFWGHRPGTPWKVLEKIRDKNTKDSFLLASLEFSKTAGMMPVAGVFTVFGKRPGLTGTLVSFERRRYEFSGTVGAATEKEAFGWLTYYPEPNPKRITVFDHRFPEDDTGKPRGYGLNQGDELPFAKEKAPPPPSMLPKLNHVEAPQAVEIPLGGNAGRRNPP